VVVPDCDSPADGGLHGGGVLEVFDEGDEIVIVVLVHSRSCGQDLTSPDKLDDIYPLGGGHILPWDDVSRTALEDQRGLWKQSGLENVTRVEGGLKNAGSAYHQPHVVDDAAIWPQLGHDLQPDTAGVRGDRGLELLEVSYRPGWRELHVACANRTP
jgi:hypothetical protein